MWKKTRIGKKKIIALFLVVIFIFLIMKAEGIVNYFLIKQTTKEQLKEEVLDIEESKQTEEMNSTEENAEYDNFQEETKEPVADDLRIHGFPYIKLTNQLQVGDFVDVRISFADGGDFVLLSKKEIQKIEPLGEEGTNSLWFIVSEEELLRLSSAVVDCYLNEGASIYAIEYVSKNQKEAIVNYVVSDFVKQLMEENPNIVEKAKNVVESSLWSEYEKNMKRENQSVIVQKEIASEDTISGDKQEIFEQVYPKQEEIIYLD